jgi:hypothetical protein
MSSGTKLHERDRLKHVGRCGEEQPVRVVGNDAGGTKRAWKPATRRSIERDTESGHFFGSVRSMGRCRDAHLVETSVFTWNAER